MVVNKQDIIDLLKENSSKLHELGVRRVGIFGSFVTGTQTANSDVDLLVEFNKGQKNFHNFIGTVNFIEAIMGRNVDLLTPESLSPYIGPYIQKEVEYVQVA